MALSPDFDQRLSALRARAEEIERIIWQPPADGAARLHATPAVVAVAIALALVAALTKRWL